MIDAIVVESTDDTDSSVISLPKSETMSVNDDLKEEKKQENGEDGFLKKEVHHQVLEAPELFGQGAEQFRVDSQINGYVGMPSLTSTGERDGTGFNYGMFCDYD